MKLTMTLAVFFYFLQVSPLRAQSLVINNVKLTLGESEATARQDIAAAGMALQNFAADSYTLTGKRDNAFDLFGEVSFEKGKVKWIQRNWYLQQTPDERNALANIWFSATTSLLEGSNDGVCIVSVNRVDNSPSTGIMKTMRIDCKGGKYLHSLTLSSADCSGGCSVGNFTASLNESIKKPD